MRYIYILFSQSLEGPNVYSERHKFVALILVLSQSYDVYCDKAKFIAFCLEQYVQFLLALVILCMSPHVYVFNKS